MECGLESVVGVQPVPGKGWGNGTGPNVYRMRSGFEGDAAVDLILVAALSFENGGLAWLGKWREMSVTEWSRRRAGEGVKARYRARKDCWDESVW